MRPLGTLRARGIRRLSIALGLLLTALPGGSAESDPRATGLIERAGSRLAQIDVTVIGPPELASSLTAEDFRVKVNLKRLEEFTLDRLCRTPEEIARAQSTTPGEPPIPAVPTATFLFYIDQNQLSLEGRHNALTTTRRLIPQLITNGNRGMLASNGLQLKVIEPFTDDASRLLAALDRLDKDRGLWDFFATDENLRVARVIEVLNEVNNIHGAMSLARLYQKEELWHTERSLRRLNMTLSRMADVGPPKAVIYFGDTLRSNPGEHYLGFFGDALRRNDPALLGIDHEAAMGALPYDTMVNTASALRIRFYPVYGRGLAPTVESVAPTGAALNQTHGPGLGSPRHRDARNTLVNLAAETGGHAFLNGERPAKLAERILKDFSCLYLISFDPGKLAEDSALRVVVKLGRDDLELRVRGRTVIQSESERRTARLLAAFIAPEATDNDFEVRATLVPTGFRDGRYEALLQLSVPGTALPGATWELGASVVSGSKVRTEVSGRLSVSRPGVPVVFESEIRFKPGIYEIISVAHETSTGLLSSDRMEINWPKPKKQGATIGPIALLQPTPGAFLRDKQSRTSGSLARSLTDAVNTSLPTALVGLICRGRGQRGSLHVERSLTGSTEVEFPPLDFDPGEDLCAQVRDLVPANSLGEGYYRYELRVSRDGMRVGKRTREFMAVSDESQPGNRAEPER